MNNQGNILVAPLNWGLGHATRCIPIIVLLKKYGYNPIIGSDGESLLLLKKEFPELDTIDLPSYNITYARNKNLIKLKMLVDSPRIMSVIKRENRFVKKLVIDYKLAGIISDNRPGIYHAEVPSVILTHQINVLSGSSTWLTTYWHKTYLNKFDQCWIPDNQGEINLSGVLGHQNSLRIPIKYIGNLSRFKVMDIEKSIDLLVILSGPPPHRELLEKKLIKQLTSFKGSIVLVRGVVEADEIKDENENFIIYNYLTSSDLEIALNQAKLVLCRSGYTSLMDLSRLGKKAYFIPTPGQYEQEYLAERMARLNRAPFCEQDKFTLEKLKDVAKYSGLSTTEELIDFNALFALFERE